MRIAFTVVMVGVRSVLYRAALGGTLLAASAAHAAPNITPDKRTMASSAPQVRLDLYGLLARTDEGDVAPGFGSTGFLLVGPLELGLSAGIESQLIGYHRAGLAALFGMRARLARVELDAAASAGVAWMHAGAGLLNDDPGAGGGIAFVGGRAGVSHAFFVSDDGRRRASLGLSLGYEHDLAPYDVTYRYTETPWLTFDGDSEPYERTSTVTIGTSRAILALMITLGFG